MPSSMGRMPSGQFGDTLRITGCSVRDGRANIYVDKVLPLDLHSVPKISNAEADGLLWIFRVQDEVNGIHYLDDLWPFSAPDSQQCNVLLGRALALLYPPERPSGL